MDSITYNDKGQAVSFAGPRAVNIYAMAVLASGLKLYAKTGIKPNRNYTPKAMMEAARRYTGIQLKPRDYEGAIKALQDKITEAKSMVLHLDTAAAESD